MVGLSSIELANPWAVARHDRRATHKEIDNAADKEMTVTKLGLCLRRLPLQ